MLPEQRQVLERGARVLLGGEGQPRRRRRPLRLRQLRQVHGAPDHRDISGGGRGAADGGGPRPGPGRSDGTEGIADADRYCWKRG